MLILPEQFWCGSRLLKWKNSLSKLHVCCVVEKIGNVVEKTDEDIVVCNLRNITTSRSSWKKIEISVITALLYATKTKFNAQPALVMTTFEQKLQEKLKLARSMLNAEVRIMHFGNNTLWHL